MSSRSALRQSLGSLPYFWQAALILPSLLLLSVFLIVPSADLFWRSLSEGGSVSLRNYRAILADGLYLRIILNSMTISFLVATISAVAGYPLGWAFATARGAWRMVILLFIYLPFLTGVLVRSFSWIIILQATGPVNWLLGKLRDGAALSLVYNRFGVLVGMTHVLLPFAVLAVATSFRQVPQRVVWAARSLGATPTSVFGRVILPLTLPGILAGFGLVFLMALGFYVTPALLGGPSDLMVSQVIDEQINRFGNWGPAAALTVLLLFITVVLVWVGLRLLRPVVNLAKRELI